MPKIKVELNHEIIDGQPITFVAPCDCSETDGLRVSYPGGTKDFVFKDAHGNDLSGIGELFLSGAYVRVLVNTVNSYAYIQNADTNKYIEDTFLKKAGGTMTGALNLTEPLNLESGGTGRNLSAIEPYSIIRAASNSAYLLSTPTADGAFFATGDNKAAKFGTLPVAQGGTGATTAVQALAKLKALNLDAITDNEFIVPSGADLNTYTTPGAYRIGTATIAGSLLNAPSYKSAGGRLIVTATSSTSGCFQFILYNTVNYQVWFRIQTSTGTWGEWEQLPTSNHMPDYVVAEGTSGDWHYRKWNSGRAECWYCEWFAPTASGINAATNLPHSYIQNWTLPFSFKDTLYSVNANIQHGSGFGIIVRMNITSTSLFNLIWDASTIVNDASVRMSIIVNGYWK